MKKINRWYKFSQNNSGGSFDVNKNLGHWVFIEAENENEAEGKAFDIGIYYNVVEAGLDCDCCGDRWHTPSVFEFPYSKYGDGKIYKTVIDLAKMMSKKYGFLSNSIRIHYNNGKVKRIGK